MKKKRHVDEELLETVRSLPCMACLSEAGSLDGFLADTTRSHPHHLITRGAGGGDVATNVMPLCQKHHQMVHRRGLYYMSQMYSLIPNWLQAAGWSFDTRSKKWRPDISA